jgi:hypothetical protein
MSETEMGVTKQWASLVTVSLMCWCGFVAFEFNDLLCYPFAIAALVGMSALCNRRFKWRGTKATCIAVSVIVLIVIGLYDTRTIVTLEGENRFQDTRTVWGNRHVYRKIDSAPDKPDSALPVSTWSAEGPIAGGERHGKWTLVDRQPNSSVSTVYYWYGDEVTEGTWELRRH